jgi:hypothetical protein
VGRAMRIGRTIAVICSAVIACSLCGACADPAVSSGSGGCREEVQGVGGKIRPETSGLSCARIKHLIEVRPSEPGGFVAIGEEPHRLWKCRVYVPKKSRVLLGCRHHEKHFSVVRGTA